MKKSIGSGRGSVYTIILKALQSGDKYGYEICKEIEEKSNGTYILKQASLYSGLKRLESQKDVCSYWGDSDIGGRRHYYSLTEKGKERIENLNFSWEDARDNLVTNLFEKTEEEKSLETLKNDIRNVSEDIDSFRQVNEDLNKQIEQNIIIDKNDGISLKTQQEEKISFIQNTEDVNSKLQRHIVSPNQQDLFSFVSNENNFHNNENTEEKNIKLDDNDDNNEIKDKCELKNEIKIIKEEKEVENNALFFNEKRAEKSAINVQDYLNTNCNNGIFNQEISNSTPLFKDDLKNESLEIHINENQQNNDFNEIDEQEIQYQEYLKQFEQEKSIENLENSVNIVKTETLKNETIIKQENTNYNQTNQETNFENDTITKNIEPSNINNSVDDILGSSYNEEKNNVDIKSIFGEFVEDEKIESKENIEDNELFKEYNEMNFKAKDDLPRIDISDNVNLTLKHSSNEFNYDTFIFNQNEEDLHFYNDKSSNNIDNKKTFQQDIPFNEKFKKNELLSEDYTVRKYSKINSSTLCSKYLNISKVNFITNLILFLSITLSTILIHILVGKLFVVNKIQQEFLTGYYIFCAILFIKLLYNCIINKNKRLIITSKNNHSLLKFLTLIFIEIIVILTNIYFGLTLENILSYYATLILPSIYFIILSTITMISSKLKNNIKYFQ